MKTTQPMEFLIPSKNKVLQFKAGTPVRLKNNKLQLFTNKQWVNTVFEKDTFTNWVNVGFMK